MVGNVVTIDMLYFVPKLIMGILSIDIGVWDEM
jgi:hypothetical protein